MGCAGALIQPSNANALVAIVTKSKRENGTGRRPGLLRASQLLVKLGTMRPPIKEMSSMTAAMPSRLP